MKAIYLLLLTHFFANYITGQTFNVNKIMTYFQDQQYEDAIHYLKPIAATDSNNIQVLGYLAYAYNVTENVNTAATYYARILAIDSTNISANQNLASIYMNRNSHVAELLTSRLMRLQPARSLHYR